MQKFEIEDLFAHIFPVLQFSYPLLEAELTFLWLQIRHYFHAFSQ